MKRLLWFLPLLLPVVILLMIINHYGVNVPYGADEFSMVPIFQKIDQGQVPLTELWEPWNEHRILFPKLVIILLAYSTAWHKGAEILASVCFSLSTAVMLYVLIRRSIKTEVLAYITALICSFWLFSPVQSENWLWAWDMEWFMCVAGAVAVVFFLCSKKFFAGAIAAAIIATLSLGGGIVTWLVGLSILAVQRQKKKVIVWISAALLTTLIYYIGYNPGNGHTLLHAVPPLDVAKSYLALFGRPFIGSLDGSMLLGSMALLILLPLAYSVWERRKYIERFLPWLALVSFGLVSNLLIAVGRAGGGVYNATSSRYTTFTIIYIIGVTGLVFVLIDQARPSKHLIKRMVLFALTMSAPLLFSSYATGLYTAGLWSSQMREVQRCTREIMPSAECGLSTEAKEQLKYLKAKHWAGY